MAEHLIGGHQVTTFTSPVAGTSPIDANVVRGNDNTLKTAYDAHDVDATIHVQDSLAAGRPVAGTAGRKWLDNDTFRVYYDDGAAWNEIAYNPTGAAASVTSLTFTTFIKSVTAFATPSALSATQFTGFASTVNGAVIMGYGTTRDVTLMNRAGTVVLGVNANTTGITMAGALTVAAGASITNGSTDPVLITNLDGGQTAYGAITFNSTRSIAGFMGIAGLVVANTLIYNVPTGMSQDFRVNNTDILRLTGSSVVASQLVTASLGLTVASGQTLTVTGATITGLTAASVAAGTFPAGSFSMPTLAVTSGLTLTGATITGAPTWSSSQAITISTATQASITTMANLTTVGALNAGSITSGFGSINIGADAITAGAASFTTGAFSDNVTVTGAQYYSVRVAASVDVDFDSGNVQSFQLASAGNVVTAANPKDGARYMLLVKQPAGGAAGTVTWPATFNWGAVGAPTLSTTNSKVDIISLVYRSDTPEYYAATATGF